MQIVLQQRLTDEWPKRLEAFEKLAASNGAPEGWLYGKVTVITSLVLFKFMLSAIQS